jgi:hypothetical protein
VKTSPERRMGSVFPNSERRMERASLLMGTVEGVLRVRGWMVRKSTLRLFLSPTTVCSQSIVCLSSSVSAVHDHLEPRRLKGKNRGLMIKRGV